MYHLYMVETNKEKQMAYMDQKKKAAIAAELKKVMPKDWKYSLGVRHHSTITLTISEAPVDLLSEINRRNGERSHGRHHHVFTDYVSVNEHYLAEQFDETLTVMQQIKAALDLDNHDRSDIMTDYFDVGHYIKIEIGKHNKPFVVA